jgi:hypothetical protein
MMVATVKCWLLHPWRQQQVVVLQQFVAVQLLSLPVPRPLLDAAAAGGLKCCQPPRHLQLVGQHLQLVGANIRPVVLLQQPPGCGLAWLLQMLVVMAPTLLLQCPARAQRRCALPLLHPVIRSSHQRLPWMHWLLLLLQPKRPDLMLLTSPV